MMKIEQSVMVKAPNVYNPLKLADWHVCIPVQARTGCQPKSAVP
jgi:hypothetical protein